MRRITWIYCVWSVLGVDPPPLLPLPVSLRLAGATARETRKAPTLPPCPQLLSETVVRERTAREIVRTNEDATSNADSGSSFSAAKGPEYNERRGSSADASASESTSACSSSQGRSENVSSNEALQTPPTVESAPLLPPPIRRHPTSSPIKVVQNRLSNDRNFRSQNNRPEYDSQPPLNPRAPPPLPPPPPRHPPPGPNRPTPPPAIQRPFGEAMQRPRPNLRPDVPRRTDGKPILSTTNRNYVSSDEDDYDYPPNGRRDSGDEHNRREGRRDEDRRYQGRREQDRREQDRREQDRRYRRGEEGREHDQRKKRRRYEEEDETDDAVYDKKRKNWKDIAADESLWKNYFDDFYSDDDFFVQRKSPGRSPKTPRIPRQPRPEADKEQEGAMAADTNNSSANSTNNKSSSSASGSDDSMEIRQRGNSTVANASHDTSNSQSSAAEDITRETVVREEQRREFAPLPTPAPSSARKRKAQKSSESLIRELRKAAAKRATKEIAILDDRTYRIIAGPKEPRDAINMTAAEALDYAREVFALDVVPIVAEIYQHPKLAARMIKELDALAKRKRIN